ncbi:MAG TPA: tetratricopeptide repeat protein [bacterium]|nr:tetratricopeptide repeat protein [bacterium]
MVQLTFGQLLKHMRLERGLSQSELAASVLTKAFVSLLERDAVRPSLSTLEHFAARLGCSLDSLLTALDSRASQRILLAIDRRAQTALGQQRYAAAATGFSDLRRLASATGVPQAERSATLGLGEAFVGLRRLSEAEPLLHQAFDAGDDAFTQCRALRSLGYAAHIRGRLLEAVQYYRAALALIPALSQAASVLHGELLAYLSTMLFRLGRFDESVAAATESVPLFEAGAPGRVAEARMNLGFVHYSLGEYEKASVEYGLALKIAEQYEDLQTIFRVRKNWAMVLIEAGQPRAALEHLTLSVTMARRLSDEHGECFALTELARCHLALGALADARATAEEAVGRSRASDRKDEVARASIVLGVVSFAEGRSQKALRYLTAAYQHCAQAEMTVEVILAGHALARIMSRCGSAAEAVAIHTGVLAALRRLSSQEIYGVMQQTKTLDAAVDHALEQEPVAAR